MLDAQREAAALWTSLETPPGSRPDAPRTENAYGGADAQATLAQAFDTPGRFSETLAWYRGRLEPQGWRVFDPKAATTIGIKWCKAPWFVDVEQQAAYDDAPPHHRFTLQLEWVHLFTGDRCPLPD